MRGEVGKYIQICIFEKIDCKVDRKEIGRMRG